MLGKNVCIGCSKTSTERFPSLAGARSLERTSILVGGLSLTSVVTVIPAVKQQISTAHQIQVSLSKNFSVIRFVWDSGVVASGESHRVSYAGPQLLPGARYWWGVPGGLLHGPPAAVHGTGRGARTAPARARFGLTRSREWKRRPFHPSSSSYPSWPVWRSCEFARAPRPASK